MPNIYPHPGIKRFQMNENESTSSKVEFVRSFFGRNVGLNKSFLICLTFKSVSQCNPAGHFFFQYQLME